MSGSLLRRFVEHERGTDGDVQRFHGSAHRNGDPFVRYGDE